MVARTRLAPQRFRKITRRLLLSRSPHWRRGTERTGARKHRSLLRKIDQRARAFRSYLPSRGRTAEYLRLDSRARAYPWHCGRSLQTIAWWEAVTAAIQLARAAWALWALRSQSAAG